MAIGAMNTIVRNNRKLLRKVSFFKKSKNFSERKKELLRSTDRELKFKEIPNEEMVILKAQIRKKAKRRQIQNTSFFVLIVVLVFTISKLYLNAIATSENELKLKSAQINLQKNTLKYRVYIEDGNDQFEKQHWKNAIYFYRKALILLPKDSFASARLHQSKENKKR